MPTILTHAAVPLALGLGLGKAAVSRRLLVAGIVASMLPDADVIAFSLGVPYGSALAHRGLTHSLGFAAIVASLGVCFYRALQAQPRRVFSFLLVAMASHGVLDAFTNGGSGIAFLWPLWDERYFMPIQVIEVSPIEIPRFFSSRGGAVLASELVWVWLPCAVLLGAVLFARRRGASKVTPSPPPLSQRERGNRSEFP